MCARNLGLLKIHTHLVGDLLLIALFELKISISRPVSVLTRFMRRLQL